MAKVIELLGNHVNYSDDGKIIEFKLGENGIRFVKEIFGIQVVKIYPGSAELMAILEFKDNVVVNESNNEVHAATENKGIKLRQIHDRCKKPIKQEKICPICNEDVDLRSLVKGYLCSTIGPSCYFILYLLFYRKSYFCSISD